ncbi:helix-turn-helix transcriptional regulator [Aureimonas sp. SK2]|uniref:helix-turn-helix domain-containing protein n=1 Tax=Aureimonas sp. SK2 TaxID=3015992 RepID=UPI0024443D9C|nr:helix-turn-helix transcriptional regulator [Aureimonas sp. SK2]
MSELDPVDLHVGSVLRDVRKRREMTLEGLGYKLGLTYQQIQKYETGKNRMSAAMLYRAAIILDVSPICFFPPAAQETPADAALRAQDIEAALSMEGIEDKRIRERLRALVGSLVKAHAA